MIVTRGLGLGPFRGIVAAAGLGLGLFAGGRVPLATVAASAEIRIAIQEEAMEARTLSLVAEVRVLVVAEIARLAAVDSETRVVEV